MTQGLTRKYQVLRHDGRDGSGQKHEGCEYFVLDLTHDEAGRVAATAYAEEVKDTNPELYRDLTRRLLVLGGWSSEEEASAWAATRLGGVGVVDAEVVPDPPSMLPTVDASSGLPYCDSRLQPNVRMRSTYMSLGTRQIIPGRYDPPGMSCDWGDCENEAPVFLRLPRGAGWLSGWLPVCESCARKPET